MVQACFVKKFVFIQYAVASMRYCAPDLQQ